MIYNTLFFNKKTLFLCGLFFSGVLHASEQIDISQLTNQVLVEKLLTVQDKILKITALVASQKDEQEKPLTQATLDRIGTIVKGLHAQQIIYISELKRRELQ